MIKNIEQFLAQMKQAEIQSQVRQSFGEEMLQGLQAANFSDLELLTLTKLELLSENEFNSFLGHILLLWTDYLLKNKPENAAFLQQLQKSNAGQ